MFPAFLNLASRKAVVVGGGPVAASKIDSLLAAGAHVTVVAPDVRPEIVRDGVTVVQREFRESDLDGAWWVVAAAPREVNRAVQAAADARRIFVNAVDDPQHASAYLGGVVRRAGVTVAISTDGRAPAIAGLLRQAFEAWLPGDIDRWLDASDALRRTWRERETPMEQRRPQLLDALNRLYEDKNRIPDPGSRIPEVALVGAGPGDPDLWTQRAIRLIERADLVLYDALVDVRALRRLTNAQCFCVGKRAGRESVRQETIHRLMLRAARAGKRVVRLKGGDPFVFGRGAEEALALAMAGIAFEIVPGVSSAIAAPELAGIPVTHRGSASGFLVLSGHTLDGVDKGLSAVQPNMVSLVVLMGLGTRADLAAALMARGWNAKTPAAVICGASTPDAWIWTGTIAALGTAEPPAGVAGVIIIGEVVKVRDVLQQRARGTAMDEVKYGRNR
jgi:uroporphyrin-III C-methyltransferase/precorrin-2 dehydrogenase/sirohydrochlorin ferrochelatase